MIILNNTEINTAEELEAAIVDFDESSKTLIRNSFYGTNTPIEPTPSDLVAIESIKYIKRQEDGAIAIRNLMSELRIVALNSPDPEAAREINRNIELAFEKVTQNILLGWWVTAKEQCELVTVGGHVSQQLWDRVYNTITNYINENY